MITVLLIYFIKPIVFVLTIVWCSRWCEEGHNFRHPDLDEGTLSERDQGRYQTLFLDTARPGCFYSLWVSSAAVWRQLAVLHGKNKRYSLNSCPVKVCLVAFLWHSWWWLGSLLLFTHWLFLTYESGAAIWISFVVMASLCFILLRSRNKKCKKRGRNLVKKQKI